jgi:hypothetical protein
MATTYVLGKTNKGTFTLWRKVLETADYQFYTFDKTRYYYLKALSKNEDKTLQLVAEYGIVSIDLDDRLIDTKYKFLWFNGETVSKLEPWQYPFGKLVGQDIRTSEDVWQLQRAAEQGNEFAHNRLIELGTHVIYEDKLIKVSEVEKLKAVEELKVEKFVKLIPTCNLQVTTTGYKLRTKEYGVIDFKRNIKAKEMYYDGYYYALPIVDDLGKSKRLKGVEVFIYLTGDVNEQGELIADKLKIPSKKEIELTKIMSFL